MTQSASGRVRVSWDSARVSAATREKKPRDKMFCFMMLRWVGGCLGLGGEKLFVPRESGICGAVRGKLVGDCKLLGCTCLLAFDVSDCTGSAGQERSFEGVGFVPTCCFSVDCFVPLELFGERHVWLVQQVCFHGFALVWFVWVRSNLAQDWRKLGWVASGKKRKVCAS